MTEAATIGQVETACIRRHSDEGRESLRDEFERERNRLREQREFPKLSKRRAMLERLEMDLCKS